MPDIRLSTFAGDNDNVAKVFNHQNNSEEFKTFTIRLCQQIAFVIFPTHSYDVLFVVIVSLRVEESEYAYRDVYLLLA